MGATDIQSSTGSKRKLRVHPSPNGVVATFATFDPDRDHVATIDVHRAEVLAALDAVPKEPERPPLADWERDLLGPQNDDGRYWHGRAMENLRKTELATTRAEKAEAERDELAATIERVREVCTELAKHGSRTAAQMEKIRAALDPKPAFVLPTEVPARIEAKRDYHGWAGELELWSNGEQQRFWRCEYDGQDYTPDGVMALFTEHRLVEPES